MAWHHPGNKPLSEPMMAQIKDAYMHHLVSINQGNGLVSGKQQAITSIN